MSWSPMKTDERRLKNKTADDDYTPAQRRIIDARLAKSDEDIRHGRIYGPFETHKEFVTALRMESAKLHSEE